MVSNEALKHAVLEIFADAQADKGIKLSTAIKQVTDIPAEKKQKEMVKYFLHQYADKYAQHLYYWCDGKKIFPGNGTIWQGDEQVLPGNNVTWSNGVEIFPEVQGENGIRELQLPKGFSQYWKLEGRPTALTKDMEALTLALTQRFVRYLLPPEERVAINALCEERTATHMHKNSWLKQIDIVPRYPPLYPKHSETEHQYTEKVVLRALKLKRGFHGVYLNVKTAERLIYYPVKLLRREWVSYVVCTTNTKTPTYKEFAIHRFKVNKASHPDNVELAAPPKGHAINYIDPEIISGIEGQWGLLEKLTLVITGPPAQHISEMRFHEANELEDLTTVIDSFKQSDGRVESATIEIRELPYTYEFKTWLLGLGAFAKVIEAVPVKENPKVDVEGDIREEIEKMNNLYK